MPIPVRTVATRFGHRAGAAVLAAASVAGLLTACSSSGSSGKNGVENITFWSAGKPSTIKHLQNSFNASHTDIKVKGEYIASSDSFTAKEVSAIQSGTEPNVVIGQDPSQLPLLAESGKVVDLKSSLKSETDALYPGIRSALFYKGRQLGFALGGVGDYALFYNKDDFRAAGISSPPTTWTQLASDAVKLSDPSKHRYGIYLPLGSAEWISYLWEGLLWSNGGSILSSDGKSVAFDSAAGVSALTTWVNLVRTQHGAPMTSFAQAGSYDGAPAFAGNDVAMIIDGQFALEPFRSAKVNFGVAALPAGTAGKGVSNIGIGVATVFDHGGTSNDAATTFVKWLGAPAQGAYQTAASSGLPSAPNQLTQAAVKKEAASDPTYKVFAAQLKTGQTRPTIPAYAAISTGLSDEIYAAMQGRISPSAALGKAAAIGNKALKGSS